MSKSQEQQKYCNYTWLPGPRPCQLDYVKSFGLQFVCMQIPIYDQILRERHTRTLYRVHFGLWRNPCLGCAPLKCSQGYLYVYFIFLSGTWDLQYLSLPSTLIIGRFHMMYPKSGIERYNRWVAISSVAGGRGRGQSAPLTAKNLTRIRKKVGNQEKGEKIKNIRKKRENREGSFTSPLTDRAGYAAGCYPSCNAIRQQAVRKYHGAWLLSCIKLYAPHTYCRVIAPWRTLLYLHHAWPVHFVIPCQSAL